jgi:hypothetical protein
MGLRPPVCSSDRMGRTKTEQKYPFGSNVIEPWVYREP